IPSSPVDASSKSSAGVLSASAAATGRPSKLRSGLPAVWKIGPVTVNHRVVMAPMAGVTDLPTRLLARELGAALSYSELVSAKGINQRNRRSLQMIQIHPAERPVGIQIFGGEPEIMARAARVVAAAGPDLIDINMGCPV